MENNKKKAHHITKTQCIQFLYEFLNPLEQIKLQLLNKYHYDVTIPQFLSRGF